jgi:hypothetical protein
MVALESHTDEIQYLMRTNVGDQALREKGKLLLIGSCMNRLSDILEKFIEEDDDLAILHVCLEETHMNQAGFKLASIIAYAGISKVTVLTVDGSPHCVQLHYMVEDIKQHFTQEIKTAHFVVEKGVVCEVSPEAVKRSRHLSKIQKTLK